jgi:hypothetical protein
MQILRYGDARLTGTSAYVYVKILTFNFGKWRANFVFAASDEPAMVKGLRTTMKMITALRIVLLSLMYDPV